MDIMQAYVNHLNSKPKRHKLSAFWTDYYIIRKNWNDGYRFTALCDYHDFCRVWRGKHPEFGEAQGMLKELLGGQAS